MAAALVALALGQPTTWADDRYALPSTVEPAPISDTAPLIEWRDDVEVAEPPQVEDAFTATEPPNAAASGDYTENPLRAAVPVTTAPAPPSDQIGEPAEPPAAAPLVSYVAPDPVAPAAEAPIPRAEAPGTPIEQSPNYDENVSPAAFELDLPAPPSILAVTSAPATPEDNGARRLAPRSANSASQDVASSPNRRAAPLPFGLSKLESLSTAGAGLAIVVGLFIVCMWLLRRSGPNPSRLLPAEAFAVLGRAPLTSQSFAHLLRIGNKLVLVAVSADGVHPLAEVTDPLEVDRIAGLCSGGRSHGPSAEFQQVLAQLSREPARGFLGGEASSGSGRRRS